MKRIVLGAAAVLALTGCAGSGAGGATAPSSTATPPPVQSAAASVAYDTAGIVCAALNALLFAGHTGTDAIATAKDAYRLTEAQVIYVIDHRCPQLKAIVPPGS